MGDYAWVAKRVGEGLIELGGRLASTVTHKAGSLQQALPPLHIVHACHACGGWRPTVFHQLMRLGLSPGCTMSARLPAMNALQDCKHSFV